MFTAVNCKSFVRMKLPNMTATDNLPGTKMTATDNLFTSA